MMETAMIETVFIKLFPAVLIALGFAPSVVWLLVYLREDAHPEPKKLILKVFLWGMLIAPLAVLAQYLVLSLLGAGGARGASLAALVTLAAIEEYLKYLVVKTEIEDSKDFNEPADAVVYMIVAALGFAAVENVSIALSLASTSTGVSALPGLLSASKVIGVRFLGATLLHAFSSAIVGYALALHVFGKKPLWIIGGGLALATALHAFFNYFILQSSEVRGGVFLVAALGMAGAVVALFRHVRRIA